jgi:hypothetical protein
MLSAADTLTFSEAFFSIEDLLAEKLDGTDNLLRKLKDNELIDETRISSIKKLNDNPIKELLSVVMTRYRLNSVKFSKMLASCTL